MPDAIPVTPFGVPTGEARAAFARLMHATAHEVIVLRALGLRVQRENAQTVPQVQAIVQAMIAERAHVLGDPDQACDLYEAACTEQLLDLALVREGGRHA